MSAETLWVPPPAPETAANQVTHYPPIQYIPPVNSESTGRAKSPPLTHFEALNAYYQSPAYKEGLPPEMISPEDRFRVTGPDGVERKPDPGRPYNQNQLQDLVTRMKETGSMIISPARPNGVAPPEDLSKDGGFEHYPGKIESARIAIRGIARTFTPGGRAYRAEARATRLSQRKDVVLHYGRRIHEPGRYAQFPFQTPEDSAVVDYNDPNTYQIYTPPIKHAWQGTGKFHTGHRRVEDRENMGLDLIPMKRPSERPVERNDLRAVTRSEKAADRRMEKQIQKWRKYHNDNAWLEESYGDSLHQDRHILARKEQKHNGAISRRVVKQRRKAHNALRKFENIRDSRDWRGTIDEIRLERAEDYLERRERRKETWEDTKDRTRVATRMTAQAVSSKARAARETTSKNARLAGKVAKGSGTYVARATKHRAKTTAEAVANQARETREATARKARAAKETTSRKAEVAGKIAKKAGKFALRAAAFEGKRRIKKSLEEQNRESS